MLEMVLLVEAEEGLMLGALVERPLLRHKVSLVEMVVRSHHLIPAVAEVVRELLEQLAQVLMLEQAVMD